MAETAEFVGRRDDRAEFENGRDLKIVVRRQSQDGTESEIIAHALDVSSSGMKLSTTTALVFAEPIALHFHSKALQVDFVIDAEVRWIRQGNEEESWLVGCAFATQLSNDDLDQLAIAGDVDRRQWPRDYAEVQATVQLSCSSKPFDATLLDYSTAGLCFSSTEAVAPSEPIRVQLVDDNNVLFEVMAKCRWNLSFESGYLIGCEVGGVDRGQFETWRQKRSNEKTETSPTRRLLGIFACFLIGSAFTLFWLISK